MEGYVKVNNWWSIGLTGFAIFVLIASALSNLSHVAKAIYFLGFIVIMKWADEVGPWQFYVPIDEVNNGNGPTITP